MKTQGNQWINGEWSDPLESSLDSKNTLILIFSASSIFDTKTPFQDIKESFPNSIIMGCSTAGEIFHDELFDNSLSISIIKFERTTIRKVTTSINSNNSREQGKFLAENLNSRDLDSIFILSEGLNINGSHLIEGIKSVIGNNKTISGGLAGDYTNFKKTWVLDETATPQINMICAVGFYGNNIQSVSNCKGGWIPFGPKRTITKSKDNILYDIDQKPSIDLYKKYLCEKTSELPGSSMWFPLLIESDKMTRDDVVRTMLSINDDDNSMTFAGDMPKGSKVQLMRADFDELTDGATKAAEGINIQDSGEETLSICISCVGRRIVLGERTEDELENTLNALPKNTLQVGFYSYGEISMGGVQICDLHNQTMSLTVIRET